MGNLAAVLESTTGCIRSPQLIQLLVHNGSVDVESNLCFWVFNFLFEEKKRRDAKMRQRILGM